MKRSVSSVLAERRKQRSAVMPNKLNVRYVKFSPEEMAYDAPADTSDWVPVGRGRKGLFAKPDGKFVKLADDVARVFQNTEAVNNALRKLIQAMPVRSEIGRAHV